MVKKCPTCGDDTDGGNCALCIAHIRISFEEGESLSRTILDEAAEITSKDRQAQYGPPENSFGTIAALWRGYLAARPKGAELGARDVAMMLALMKVARDANKPKRDNLVDIAGYARCAEMIG